MKDSNYDRIKNLVIENTEKLWEEQKYAKLKLGEVIDILIDKASEDIIRMNLHDYWLNLWAFNSNQFQKELSQAVALAASEEYFKYDWNKE